MPIGGHFIIGEPAIAYRDIIVSFDSKPFVVIGRRIGCGGASSSLKSTIFNRAKSAPIRIGMI
jgi:hypothetical protein